jgi:hypothetical protein
MAAATDYLEAEVLDHILGKGTRDFTSPANLFVALFTSATSDAGAGTEVGSGVNYIRKAVTFDAAATDSGVTSASNSGDIEFGPCQTTNWGTISHIAIYDAETSGNMLFHGALSTAKTITVDDSLRIGAGNLTIELQ